MKVAILLPGMLRNFEVVYPYFKKYVIDPLNPDIFFYGYPNKKGLEYCESKIIELWNPKKYTIREYTTELRKEICPYENELYMGRNTSATSEKASHTWMSGIYCVKNANALKQQYEQENNFLYDVVIKSRTDWFYYREHSKEELERAERGELLIPEAWDFKSVNEIGASDVSAVSDSKNIDAYSSLYDNIEKYFREGVYAFHPETYCGIHVDRQKLNRTPLHAGVNDTGWCVSEHPNNPHTPFNRESY